jgi:pimeloyl-ACP methyl ester carboxylesterase
VIGRANKLSSLKAIRRPKRRNKSLTFLKTGDEETNFLIAFFMRMHLIKRFKSPSAKKPMKRNVFTPLLVGIWISIAGLATAFESDYISVRAEGNGPDIILVHGFACSPQVWSGLAEEIGSQFRLHFVAVAGFAGSAAPKVDPESYQTNLRDEFARYINEKKLEKPTLVGHSMGGLASLLVASKESPKIGKVIVVDALPFFSLLFNPLATTEQVLPQSKALEKQVAGLDAYQFEQQAKSSVSILTKSDEKKEQLLKWSKESDRKVYAKYLSEMMAYDARPELKTIACPVTVFYSYDEAMRVPEAQLKLLYSTAYENLKTVSIKSVSGSFHFVMWDQPKDFYTMMKEVLVPVSAPQPSN